MLEDVFVPGQVLFGLITRSLVIATIVPMFSCSSLFLDGAKMLLRSSVAGGAAASTVFVSDV